MLDLLEYDTEIKIQILLNHIDYSDISVEFKDTIKQKEIFILSQNIKTLIQDPQNTSFLPIISRRRMLKEYEKFIIQNFDDPREIWRHAFEPQLYDWQRMMVNSHLTFNEKTDLSLLSL